jgi:hypothetical protein
LRIVGTMFFLQSDSYYTHVICMFVANWHHLSTCFIFIGMILSMLILVPFCVNEHEDSPRAVVFSRHSSWIGMTKFLMQWVHHCARLWSRIDEHLFCFVVLEDP